ncbi:MAG: hypothetical protein WC117_08630, partial [Sphaerochaetaceae bacterium]
TSQRKSFALLKTATYQLVTRRRFILHRSLCSYTNGFLRLSGGCSTVFDSHVGSGSSRIACWELGFDFEGCEIDPFYFSLEEKRFEERIKQPKLFEVKQGKPEEPELFQGDEDAEN